MDKQKITIVGGGTSGWVTAAILSKGLCSNDAKKDSAKGFDITVVESPDVPTIGVGEATIPPIVLLLDYLEIDRKSFLSQVNGTYKYGIHFENWSKIGDQYMHSFGAVGTPINGVPFTDLWLSSASEQKLGHLNEYSATAIAAYANKFHPPLARPQGANPNHFFPLTSLQYAYHFDAGLLIQVLKEYAIARGVKNILGTVDTIHSAGDNDDIQQVRLSNGDIIEAKIFVDCSGMRGLFNKQHYGCEFVDWSHYLPCNSAIAMQTQVDDAPIPYTKSIAMSSGWRWQIPLRNRLGNGYVYSDQHISDEQAEAELRGALVDHKILTEPRVLKFKTGCLKQPWFRNSIAIGLSSGFFEPLESTSIHLVHKYAVLLKEALESDNSSEQNATEFNASFMQDALAIRDFLVAHYCITQREDSSFWQHCKTMNIPESLQFKLSQFKQTGKLELPENNLFSYESWLMLLTGQHYLSDYSQFNNKLATVKPPPLFFKNVNMAIRSEVAKIDSHQDYLSK